jgi:hypothetical protein
MSDRIPTYELAKTMSIIADEIGDSDKIGSETIHHVSRRLIELRRLLELIEPIVSAHYGAAHMLDGFRKQPRPEIDSLVEAIKTELEN